MSAFSLTNKRPIQYFQANPRLQTGDILLFVEHPKNSIMKLFTWMITTATHSEYSHAAVVLKDPTFIHPSLKGLFLWESSWEGTPDPQDNKIKLGVQITPIYQFLQNFAGQIYVRRLLKGSDLVKNDKLQKIHNVVYEKPYDIHIKDWVDAWNRTDSEPQKTDRFWCSALVAYILVSLKFLPDETDWSIIRPSDLSSKSTYLKFCECCEYGEDTQIY